MWNIYLCMNIWIFSCQRTCQNVKLMIHLWVVWLLTEYVELYLHTPYSSMVAFLSKNKKWKPDFKMCPV
jgi:hypothetical protein